MASVTIHLSEAEVEALDQEAKRTGVSRHALALEAFRRGFTTGSLDVPQRRAKDGSKAELNRIAHLERKAYEVENPEARHALVLELLNALEAHWRSATPKTEKRRWARLRDKYVEYLGIVETEPLYLEVALRLLLLTKPDLTAKQAKKTAHALWIKELERRTGESSEFGEASSA
ncbi:MAG: CopG family transcriptional regulator [Polyangiaceae bacterium]|nr:CopG family transcriptional regulator [Polyangiaceae bacterium]